MAQTVHARYLSELSQQETSQAVTDLLHSFASFNQLAPNTRVLLKPNLLAKHAPEAAVTTHPFVIRAVVLALQAQGVTDITIADSSGGLYTPAMMKSIYAVSGITAICEETGAKQYLECHYGPKAADGKVVRQFNLINPVLESDFIINLPKLKTHVMTGMSGAVKNVFGCVPGLQKAEFHMQFPEKDRFGNMLVDLCETVKADIHLVDGLISMEGDGPAGGTPRQTNLLLAGENPYSVDLAICRYMDFPPMNTPFLAAAHQRGLCPDSFDESLLQGEDRAKSPFKAFQHPQSYSANLTFTSQLPKVFQPIADALQKWAAPKPVILRQTCIGCGKCAEICPQQVITIQDKKAKIKYKNCIRCFCCHEMCPVKAIDVHRNRLLHRD